MRDIKIRYYTAGTIASFAGVGLYSYYVRELLASLALFSIAFSLMALIVLGTYLVWFAAVQLAIWTGPASQNVISFSRRFIAIYARN